MRRSTLDSLRKFLPRAGRRRPRDRHGARESGYAFLMVMGMVVILAILSQAALQNLYTQGRRMREDEMIWRGNQFVRAIRLYYRKTGHYPQSIDDLKSGVADLHFLRYAAYKDPINRDEDGAWRFIYVNAGGQIIGSVRYANLQQMALMDLNGGKIPVGATLGSLGTPVANMASNLAGMGAGSSGNSLAPTQNGNTVGASSATASGTAPGAASGTPSGTQPGTATDNSSQGDAQNTASSQSSSSDQLVNPLSLLKPTGPVDGPVIGGFLTGVGGGTKSDANSIKWVNGGKKYKDWEFIWNPLEDQARALQSGLGGLGTPAAIGSTAPTSIFGNPAPGGTSSPGFGGAVVPPPSQTQPQNQ